VALSGDGGDELFWGYPRNVKMLHQGAAFKHSKWKRGYDLAIQKIFSKERSISKRHLIVNDFPSFYYRSLFITGADYWLPRIFKGKASNAFFFDSCLKETTAFNTDPDSIMNTVRKLEFDLHLQRILVKVDRASMYHSLEVRVPMLSNDMLAYSAQLNYRDCIVNGEGKANLKSLLASVSDPQLVYQPKKGFVVPMGEWIRQQLKNDIYEKLLDMPPGLLPFFDRKQILKLLQEHMQEKHDWSWFIWSLYSLVNWSSHHRNSIS